MNNNIKNKLQQLLLRLEEVEVLLADSAVMANAEKFKNLSIEYAELSPVVKLFRQYLQAEEDLLATQAILKTDDDDELKQMAKDEIAINKELIKNLEFKLKAALLPKDKYDNRNIILEIRAGTGGDEASIFVGDLFKMYSKYVEKQGWKIEVISSSFGDHGGFKEIIASIHGNSVYEKMKFESGTHRVQRVPETESQGRVHTSACTVAIMPEVDDITEIDINMNDVRIDTFRASGAGGQHVNKTDSAVRVTHIPTNTVVECQDGRSQHKNKAQALSVLASRILSSQQEQQAKEQASQRKSQVGSGDRSEKIRTYNYPQGRVSDHRIKLTLYKLNEVMEGDLAEIIEPLILEKQTREMAEIDN